MNITTLESLFGIIAVVAACSASTSLWPRACAPGTLVCNGNSKFGICDMSSKVVWMAVADGTECICLGSICTITAAGPPASTPNSKFQNNQAFNPSGSSTLNYAAPISIPTTSMLAIVNSVSAPVVAPPSSSAVASTSSQLVATLPSTTLPSSGSPRRSGYVSTFLGHGDPSEGWPPQSDWVDFVSMWSTNLDNVISKSCETFGQTNNSDDESVGLKSAIQSVAESSGVDERFILAIVMQESGGCVRYLYSN